MKWTYLFKNKLKAAVLFLSVALMVLGCTFMEDRYMKAMDNSVSSIYKDRLMPEAYLLHINNHMFNKRLLLEGYLHAPEKFNANQLQAQLNHHSCQIDSLIAAVEHTFLVPEEAELLGLIKVRLASYHTLEESELQQANPAQANQIYTAKLLPLFNLLNSDLLALSNIQTSVGKTLYQDSRTIKVSAWTLSHLQIAFVILITLAVYALLFSARSEVPKKFQSFNLN